MSPYLARPVASLTVEVEDESGRTADGGEAVASFEVVLDATHGVPEAATVLLVTFDRNGGSNWFWTNFEILETTEEEDSRHAGQYKCHYFFTSEKSHTEECHSMCKPVVPAVGLCRESKVLVAGAVLAQLLDHRRVAVFLLALFGAEAIFLRQDERRRRGDDDHRKSDQPHFERGYYYSLKSM